jgi:hypothetical protein
MDVRLENGYNKAAHVFCRYIYSTHDITINTIYGGNVTVRRMVLQFRICVVEVWIRPEFRYPVWSALWFFSLTPGNVEGEYLFYLYPFILMEYESSSDRICVIWLAEKLVHSPIK